MSDTNLQADPIKLQQDIEELKLKYSTLSKEVEQLENNKAELGTDIKQIHGEFEQIYKSIQEILEKLNKFSNEFQVVDTKVDKEKEMNHSMRRFLAHPLRRIAVGTLSAVYTMADKTIEKASGFKESLEDIVAEAQYANKKKKMNPLEES